MGEANKGDLRSPRLARGSTLWNTRFAMSLPRHMYVFSAVKPLNL
jgi:hypothetical protein